MGPLTWLRGRKVSSAADDSIYVDALDYLPVDFVDAKHSPDAALVTALRRELAGESGTPLLPLHDDDLLRYLRARDMQVDMAAKALRETLAWRREFRADAIAKDRGRRATLRTELATMKLYLSPARDREGRPVVLSRPRRENTRSHEGNVLLRLYLVERATALMRLEARAASTGAPGAKVAGRAPPDGKIVFVTDMRGFQSSRAPPFKTARETMRLMSTHYPERLGKAIMIDAPRFVEDAWRIARRWLDPATQAKVMFIRSDRAEDLEALDRLVDRAGLEADFGGLLPNLVEDDDEEAARAAADAFLRDADDPILRLLSG